MIKKKLLFLLPSLVGGGAERTLINLLQQMDYSKYEITLLLILKKGTYLNQVPKQVKLVYLFSNQFLIRVLYYFQKKFNSTSIFRNIIKNKIVENYDVGISFLDGNFTDILLMIPKLNKKYAWVHSSYKSYNNFNKYYRNKKYLEKIKIERYSKLDGIFFVSHDAKKEFLEVFGEGYKKMEVVYNLMNADSVKFKAKEKFSFNNNKFNFISVGSLIPIKGYDLLIEAVNLLSKTNNDFHLTIVGHGHLENNLKLKIANLELNTFVSFAGFQTNPYKYLANCDAFVMSSLSEALPTVLCEAMILGKPTLVTNCSGCREIVGHGEFGMMSEINKEDLMNKMEAFINKPSLIKEYRLKSLERSKLFDDQSTLLKYQQIFDSY